MVELAFSVVGRSPAYRGAVSGHFKTGQWGCDTEEFLLPKVLKSDVWLHHAPPSECSLGRSDYGGQSIDFGSDDLFAALSPGWGARAQLVLSGHVHTATKWQAKCGHALCLNAAGDNPNAPVPKHVLIDLEASTAIMRNGLMVEMVRLPERIYGCRLNDGNAAQDCKRPVSDLG